MKNFLVKTQIFFKDDSKQKRKNISVEANGQKEAHDMALKLIAKNYPNYNMIACRVLEKSK